MQVVQIWVAGSGNDVDGHELDATHEFDDWIRNDYEAPDVVQAVQSVADVRHAVHRMLHIVHWPVPVF